MKNLSIAFLAAVSLMTFAGCKKKSGGGDYVAKMTEFKDQMCKCADKACADKVSDAMAKWSKEGGDKAAPSEDDTKKLAPVNDEFAKCMSKAMMPPAGDKPAEPAAAAPAAPPPAGDKPADPAAGSAAPAAGSN